MNVHYWEIGLSRPVFILKVKKTRVTYIIVSKGTLHFKYVFKEQTKQLQKDEIKEESQLNCTNVFFL